MTIRAAVTGDVTAVIEDFGPGPLPVIKTICEVLGIHNTLNEQLTWDEIQCNLSLEHRLLALIMNVLTEFFEGTDVENLFGEGVDPEVEITHGYSTDSRRDLRQFKAGLGVNRAGVPVLGEILDGNAADKTWNTELIGELDEWLDLDELPIYVADSAAFTENTIDEAADHGIELITRVPRTYSAVDVFGPPADASSNGSRICAWSGSTRNERSLTTSMSQSESSTWLT